jgi:capsular polysaccharide biosynthesis protein
MSQQGLDLRRSFNIVRRHKVLVGFIVVLGILIGDGYALLNPPMLTSTALVVLPQSVQNAAQNAAANNGADAATEFMATQAVIAGSNPVLQAALPHALPAMSLQQLRNDIEVSNSTSYVISITAKAKNSADAETTANAVANSYIAYVGAPDSPVGYVPARMLELAVSTTGTGALEALIITGLIGALAGFVIGAIVALAISRKDKRLRGRDEIANSIGIPVLASIPVDHPHDAPGWARLLDSYKPAFVYAWRMRKALQELGPAGGSLGDGDEPEKFSVTVLSLSSDPGALALGPQLAVFVASLGVPVALVIGPQQDENATAALRAACVAVAPASASRPGSLRIVVHDGGGIDDLPAAELTVVVCVIDGWTPQIPETMQTSVTVLGISAGAVSAEQLARAAMVAATHGSEVAGILVADPETTDQTTGRIPHLTRPAQHRKPRRLSGMATETRR